MDSGYKEKRRAGDLNPIASRTILVYKTSSGTCQLPAVVRAADFAVLDAAKPAG
jgi:hypothetical protein